MHFAFLTNQLPPLPRWLSLSLSLSLLAHILLHQRRKQGEYGAPKPYLTERRYFFVRMHACMHAEDTINDLSLDLGETDQIGRSDSRSEPNYYDFVRRRPLRPEPALAR